MSVVLTSDKIKSLCSDGCLTIVKKSQKNTGNYNYYITPNLALNLYGGKVIVSDQKYLVLQFEKYDKDSCSNLNLLNFLRTTTSCISDYLKSCTDINTELMYPLFNEHDTTLTLRVYLPHVRQKYFIETKLIEENEVVPFKRPMVGVVIRQARVDIRNLWQNKGRVGFNLELKYLGL